MVYNRQSHKRTVAPTNLPVTLPEVKNFCGLEDSFTEDDALLMDFIRTATTAMEKYTRRAFITQTWTLTMDRFPLSYTPKAPMSDGVYDLPVDYASIGGDCFELYNLPVQSITSIVTFNDSNTSATLSASAYRLDASGERVYLNQGFVWPTDLRDFEAVVVTYVAGYGDNSTTVPDGLRTAIKVYVNALYESRGACMMPELCKGLAADYRLMDRLGAGQR